MRDYLSIHDVFMPIPTVRYSSTSRDQRLENQRRRPSRGMKKRERGNATRRCTEEMTIVLNRDDDENREIIEHVNGSLPHHTHHGGWWWCRGTATEMFHRWCANGGVGGNGGGRGASGTDDDQLGAIRCQGRGRYTAGSDASQLLHRCIGIFWVSFLWK